MEALHRRLVELAVGLILQVRLRLLDGGREARKRLVHDRSCRGRRGRLCRLGDAALGHWQFFLRNGDLKYDGRLAW